MPIDFRKNANVLTAVESKAKRKQQSSVDPYVVDGYELHARPDLADRLKELMAQTPGASMEFAFGLPMLITPAGRVFAIAQGTHSLSLFLPEEQSWGRIHPDYGRPWRQSRAWGNTAEDEHQLTSLMHQAHSAAAQLDSGH